MIVYVILTTTPLCVCMCVFPIPFFPRFLGGSERLLSHRVLQTPGQKHRVNLPRAFSPEVQPHPDYPPTLSKLGSGSRCGQLTCLSHAAAAFQDAGEASDPLEPLWSTHRAGCHWWFLGNWGRELGRWWHCALLLHTGLGAESDMPGGEGPAERSGGIGVP